MKEKSIPNLRKGMKDKYYYVYPSLFKEIYDFLLEADSLFPILMWHNSCKTVNFSPTPHAISVDIFEDVDLNVGYITEEIFDDLLAFFHCFNHGFIKQSQGILRTALELLVILIFLKYGQVKDKTFISWKKGEFGIVNSGEKIDELKKVDNIVIKKLKLKNLYNQLCSSTHSRKYQMNSINSDSGTVINRASFNPLLTLQSKALFWTLVSYIILAIKEIISEDYYTEHKKELYLLLRNLERKASKYDKLIRLVEKGYLIFHRQFNYKSKNIMFSVKIDGSREFKTKIKCTIDEKTQINKKIDTIIFYEPKK